MPQQPPQINPVLVEWGWKTALGFIGTGLLGLCALILKWSIPVLGERVHRMLGERAFRAEWVTLTQTAESVARMEPTVNLTAEQVRMLDERMTEGFAALHEAILSIREGHNDDV